MRSDTFIESGLKMGLPGFRLPVRGRHCALCVFCFTGLVAPAALGVESEDTFRLVWVRAANASSCPGQLEVERQVRSRLGRDPFDVDANRIINARVSSDGALWHVQLSVTDNLGTALGQRSLDVGADNCGEVADTVSLAVALAIDPNVPLQAKAPLANAAAESFVNLPAPAAQPSAPPATFSAPYRHPNTYETRPPMALEARWNHYQSEVTLRGVAAAGLLPGFAGGTSVAGAFGRSGARLTLALLYLPESKRNGFAYGLAAVSSGLCVDVARSRLLATGLCGEFALGAIHAVVYRLEPLHPGDRLTAAVGFGPKIGWHAWAPLFFEVGVSTWVGLVQPKFSILGADSTHSTTEFQSRLVSGTGFVGVGVATP